MSSGKSGLLDTSAVLLCGIAYIAYVLLGLALFVIGIAYYSEIENANQSASLSLIAQCRRSSG